MANGSLPQGTWLVRSAGISLTTALCATALGQALRLHEWRVLEPGDRGAMISPHEADLVVEHCDVTNRYITINGGGSWRVFYLRSGISTLRFDSLNDGLIYAGNAALRRSDDHGRTWKVLLLDPKQGTVEHQLGDYSDYALTSKDRSYPGGNVSIA